MAHGSPLRQNTKRRPCPITEQLFGQLRRASLPDAVEIAKVLPDQQRARLATFCYLASTCDCRPCPLKHRCCPKTPQRKIPRDLNEDARDVARAIHDTPAYDQSRKDRKRVEMAFAHLKRILKLGRLRLRGPTGASDEFLLAATAQNLRKLAGLRAKPPPIVQPA